MINIIIKNIIIRNIIIKKQFKNIKYICRSYEMTNRYKYYLKNLKPTPTKKLIFLNNRGKILPGGIPSGEPQAHRWNSR